MIASNVCVCVILSESLETKRKLKFKEIRVRARVIGATGIKHENVPRILVF